MERLYEGGVGKADRLNLGFFCKNKACLTLEVTRKIVLLWQASMQNRNNQVLY